MNSIQELIEVAERLCYSLEEASKNEKKFCDDVCHELEHYSWEVFRMKNNLAQLKENYGG